MRYAAALLLLFSCGDDQTSAPPRTTGPGSDAGSDASAPADSGSPTDAGTPDADATITYPDPLAGTTKTATLVKSGFAFTEGPVWIGGRLLFSDVNNNVIQELLADGGTSPFRTNTNGANGLATDPQGRLWACQGGNKRVTRNASDVTTTYNAAAYNAPNDIIVRKDGTAYFTDPNYSGNPDTQDAHAVYRISPNDDGVTRLSGTWVQPNGIALSPDESILYVIDNGSGELRRATVSANGDVGAFTDFHAAQGGDGMAVDDAGNLYIATTNGILVLDASGKDLGTITVAQVPANCTFGGAARKTLYITARTGLYSIDLNVPGLP